METYRIAVIGGGIAGIGAAYLLQRKHEVTLFESNDYLGGHTHTVLVRDGKSGDMPVDTGFIVFNDRNYPLLNRFFEKLGVRYQHTDMSLSVFCADRNFYYSSDFPNGLFAQRRNLVRPFFWKLIFEIDSFYKKSRRALRDGSLGSQSLEAFLSSGGFSRSFIEEHLLPMAACIWSAPMAEIRQFPAESFLRFYENHGLLDFVDKPQWRTVCGGSHEYVKAFCRDFRGKILLQTPVKSIRREAGKVRVEGDGFREDFDKVVIAVHADQALGLLRDPGQKEKELLGKWRYSRNETVLHSDREVMPPVRRAWASWNFLRQEKTGDAHPVAVTYYMNRLQHLRSAEHYFVTLNLRRNIEKARLCGEFLYEHPVFDDASVQTQAELREISGRNNTFYCGSYLGYGFHEDGIRSGVEVAGKFGIEL